MKNLRWIGVLMAVVLVLLVGAVASAQDATPEPVAPAAGQGVGPGWMDKDGDGKCDNFIDADGDGVCDLAGQHQGMMQRGQALMQRGQAMMQGQGMMQGQAMMQGQGHMRGYGMMQGGQGMMQQGQGMGFVDADGNGICDHMESAAKSAE